MPFYLVTTEAFGNKEAVVIEHRIVEAQDSVDAVNVAHPSGHPVSFAVRELRNYIYAAASGSGAPRGVHVVFDFPK